MDIQLIDSWIWPSSVVTKAWTRIVKMKTGRKENNIIL